MGKDSEYYKNKTRNQKIKLRELIDQLPDVAADYIYSKELVTQASTLISYSYDLLTFFRFLKEKNPSLRDKDIKEIDLKVLSQIDSKDIVEFQRYLELNVNPDGEFHENGKRAIARKMSPLRGMFKYHLMHKNLSEDPTALVELPKLKKDKNIVRMTNDEVVALLNAIEAGTAYMSDHQRNYCKKTQKRDLAILTLMLGTGIRVSECCGLDLNDIDFNANTMTIVRKGGGQDILYFDNHINHVLSDYVENERKLIKPYEQHQDALFYSLQGKRISVDSVEGLVKKYAKIIVPNKKITPHKLRSTYGTALYRETGDIRLVADVLGHENVNTTVNYYAAMEDEHKQQAAGAVQYDQKNKLK
ncbi:MAG: tyrosine-type recombinase/integrase [Lachnospiraceae bacterium]|nr:tyrosine-type recombinase/integrase [Lachnospiraceae bacterium]